LVQIKMCLSNSGMVTYQLTESPERRHSPEPGESLPYVGLPRVSAGV